MRTVISVVQRKGGVGKTTIAVCLAGELRSQGYNVSLVDSDTQQSASTWAEPGQLPFTVHNLPLHAENAAAWGRQIQSIKNNFVIVDTAPTEFSLRCAVLLADLILVPCTPSGLDLETTASAVEFIRKIRTEYGVRLPTLIVPNRVDSRTLEGRQILEELKRFNESVGPVLGSRSAYVRAFSSGQTIRDFAPRAEAQAEIHELTRYVLSASPGRSFDQATH